MDTNATSSLAHDMTNASESSNPVQLNNTVDISVEGRGVVRLRKWVMRDVEEIGRLCDAKLPPRLFADELLAHQSVDPPLTKDDLGGWEESHVLKSALGWWNANRTSKETAEPAPPASLEEFQKAVCASNANFRAQMREMVEVNWARARELTTLSVAFRKDLLKHTARPFKVEPPANVMRLMTEIQSSVMFAPKNFGRELMFEKAREASLAFSVLESTRKDAGLLQSWATLPAIAEMRWPKLTDSFRTFELAHDHGSMIAAFKGLNSSLIGQFAPKPQFIENVMSSLQPEWISRIDPGRSLESIAKLSALAGAVRFEEPFHSSAAIAIQQALGNWIDIRMPPRVIRDSIAREHFYLEHGFDRWLVQIPEPAFSQAVRSTGLLWGPPKREPPCQETVLIERIQEVSRLIVLLERRLRSYINRVMTGRYGAGWERTRCHGNGTVYKQWLQKRKTAVRPGAEPEPLINYADFTDYSGLITRSDNWKEVFHEVFKRQESVRESFNRLGPIRICVMHSRPITKTELIFASAEVTRLLTAIGCCLDED